MLPGISSFWKNKSVLLSYISLWSNLTVQASLHSPTHHSVIRPKEKDESNAIRNTEDRKVDKSPPQKEGQNM
jgi:hypothetical protein